MKKLSLIATLILSVSCSTIQPIETTPLDPITVAPNEPPSNDQRSGEAKVALQDLAAYKQIMDVTGNSSCAAYKWKDRGRAPKSYVQGVALSFARELCHPDPIVAKKVHGETSADALAYYAVEPSAISTYNFILGLGMRESSGGLDCGRDASAENTSAITAEAGAWQTSWNVTWSSKYQRTRTEMVDIFNQYKNGERSCLSGEYTKNVTCKPAQFNTHYGTGIGRDYQILAKTCPAFAAAFAAHSIRLVRSHYGPINTKKVEYLSTCRTMLDEVQKIVTQNRNTLCEAL